MSGTASVIELLKKELQKTNGVIYGITGNGEYAVKMNFRDFMKLYRFIWGIKTGENVGLTARTQLEHIASENLQQLKCTYIRAKYPASFANTKLSEQERANTGIVKKYEDELESLIERIMINTNLDSITKNHIRERILLVKELTYTYSDFLFQKSSWWKGLVFYTQIDGIIKGIDQYLDTLDGVDSVKKKEKKEYRKEKEILTEKLYSDINKSIACVNNFNKLLQSMNQYVINVPNYEMQTKVNVEKYLMAYTMYLFEISNSYFHQHKEYEKIEKVLPLFSIDRTEGNIQAYTFFGAMETVKKDTYAFFMVLCPNYQWFSDIYHVLPMITHEISHNFRFVNRKTRNEAVLHLVLVNISKTVIQNLLENVTGNHKDFFEELERFFWKIFHRFLLKSARKIWEVI